MKLAKLLTEKALVVDVSASEDTEERVAVAIAVAKTLANEQGIEFEMGAAEDLAGVCQRRPDAAEDRSGKTGDVRGGAETRAARRCGGAGHFREDHDGVGVGGFAGDATA